MHFPLYEKTYFNLLFTVHSRQIFFGSHRRGADPLAARPKDPQRVRNVGRATNHRSRFQRLGQALPEGNVSGHVRGVLQPVATHQHRLQIQSRHGSCLPL